MVAPSTAAAGVASITAAGPGFPCPGGLHRRRHRFSGATPCAPCRAVDAAGVLVEALSAALPGMARGDIEAAVAAVSGYGETLREVGAWLASRPDPLRDGENEAPAPAQRLLVALRGRGAVVAFPVCVGCSKPAPRLQTLTGQGRLCVPCSAVPGHQECSSCGKVALISTRDAQGRAVCPRCRRVDPVTWRACGRCGVVGQIAIVHDGVLIGRCCYVLPAQRCTVCGISRGVQPHRTKNPVCVACASRPLRPCTDCGADALDPRPATDLPIDPMTDPTTDSVTNPVTVQVVAGHGRVRCARCVSRATRACVLCGTPTADRAVDGSVRCLDCYHRPTGPCGRCRRVKVIVRRAVGDDPDLCGLCWRGPVTTCARCGRRRPCRGERSGVMLCDACRPGWPAPCTFCGRTRRVSAHWPDGPVCGACYSQHRRQTGPCPLCGLHRMLVRRTRGEPACPSRLEIPHPDLCDNCGSTDEPLWGRGRCPTCALAAHLTFLLQDLPPVEGLNELRESLLGAPSPRAVMEWLTRTGTGALLIRLLSSHEPITHNSLDALPRDATVNQLRHLLVAVATLPDRDPVLAGLVSWTGRYLTTLPTAHAAVLALYSRWHIQRPLNQRARRGPLTDTTGYSARARLRGAAAFLAHLSDRGHTLADADQHDLDTWHGDQPDHRVQAAAAFLTWATRRHAMPALDRPPARTFTSSDPILDLDQQWATARRLLHDPGIDPADRVAGALVVIYAQNLTRISRLRPSDITLSDHVRLRLGRTAITVPEPLAGYVRILAAGHRLPSNAHLPAAWVFPSRIAKGRPVSALTLGKRLTRLGIVSSRHRRSALFHLSTTMPAAVLADLLGVNITTATRCATLAAHDRHDYLELPPVAGHSRGHDTGRRSGR